MKIAVLLSGGVDSAVVLTLLKKKGYDVEAFYLKIWLEDELSFLGDCPWQEDLFFARKICQNLNVKLEVISLQQDYWENVVSYTIDQIRRGYTPNPDMLCNSIIKFGRFYDLVGHKFDRIASGHYATILHEKDHFFLVTSPDLIKDQTYFLAALTPQQLKKCLFPIGHFTKDEVRTFARDYGLCNCERKDSQGVCFLGKIRFSDFIAHHLGEKEGDIVEWDTGNFVGKHKGFWFFTIGQRRGLSLGSGPWYVVEKDITKNVVYVSKNLLSKKVDEIRVLHCRWLYSVEAFQFLLKNNDPLQVKIRHGQKRFIVSLAFDIPDKRHKIVPPKDFFAGALPQSIFCRLVGGDEGIASGQFAVFYSGKYCLGSGMIERVRSVKFVEN